MTTENQEKKLWRLRFRKILKLEEEAVGFYRKILDKKKTTVEETGIKPVLEGILRDEGRHIRIARELLRLAGVRPPQRKR